MGIKLGDIVKDRLTDLCGTVFARAEYLYGCIWVCVVPKKLHEGKPIESVWVDEARLEKVVQKKKALSDIEKEAEECALARVRRYGPGPAVTGRSVPNPSGCA